MFLARCFLDLLVVRQAEPKFRTLLRGRESRAEKIEPCVASAEGSTFLTHRHRPATQGSIFSARVAEGFDVFLPVYKAAPPVTAPPIDIGVRNSGTGGGRVQRFLACLQRGAACNRWDQFGPTSGY